LRTPLELVLLIRQQRPDRYSRAAARWAARWSTELPGVDLAESQLVQAALASLATEDGKAGGWTLLALARRRRLKQVQKVLLGFVNATR
jgi:hypothetical protein